MVLNNWKGATVWYYLSDASPTVGEVGEVEEVVINNEVSNREMADDGSAQSGTSSGSDDSEAGETPQEESSDDESSCGEESGEVGRKSTQDDCHTQEEYKQFKDKWNREHERRKAVTARLEIEKRKILATKKVTHINKKTPCKCEIAHGEGGDDVALIERKDVL